MADDSNNPNNPTTKPQIGDRKLDISDMNEFLVDLPPGGLVGLAHEKENLDTVRSEILGNQEKWGKKAGITQEDLDTIEECDRRIAMIDERIKVAYKIAEVLKETRAVEVDRRERKIKTVSKKVILHSEDVKDEAIKAVYQTTVAYPSQDAAKAAKARQKNEEEAKKAEEEANRKAGEVKPGD